jgi:DNA-directed RNA polymerase specialized sigma24 family protein
VTSAERAEYYRKRRKRLIAANLCIGCAKREPRPTSQRCDACSEPIDAYHARQKSDAHLAPDGMSVSEIAAELGITCSAAHMTLHRALKKLVKACRRYGVEPGDIVGRQSAFSSIVLLERWS